jgi:hypothetical protein
LARPSANTARSSASINRQKKEPIGLHRLGNRSSALMGGTAQFQLSGRANLELVDMQEYQQSDSFY